MTTTPPRSRRFAGVARSAVVALVVLVGFFAAQGEAADAQQLRVAPSDAGGRFTAPAPLAGGHATLGSTAASAGRSRLSTSLLAVVHLPSRAEQPTFVSDAESATDLAVPLFPLQRAHGRSPPAFLVI
jgi:hypothetical protein